MSREIAIPPGPNGFTGDKEQAQQIRLAEILPALDRGEHVVLDFSRVSHAPHSYVYALIGEALQKHGAGALDLLEFKNCSASLRSVIEWVVDFSGPSE